MRALTLLLLLLLLGACADRYIDLARATDGGLEGDGGFVLEDAGDDASFSPEGDAGDAASAPDAASLSGTTAASHPTTGRADPRHPLPAPGML